MPVYLFSASDISPSTFSHSIESFYKNCDDSFGVVLPEPDFLHLLGLLELSSSIETELISSQDFKSIFDLSNLKLPELNLEEFNSLYEEWLKLTGRESSMDEYGQLVFIQNYASIWNMKKYRFVLVENS